MIAFALFAAVAIIAGLIYTSGSAGLLIFVLVLHLLWTTFTMVFIFYTYKAAQ